MPFHVPERRVYTVTLRRRAVGQRNRVHTYYAELNDAEKLQIENAISNTAEVAEGSVVPTDILVLTELRAALWEELQLEVV